MSVTLVTRETRDLIGCSSAVFSEDGTYRYLLTRTWDAPPYVTWVMLNPSTADENASDPTISRCVRFARNWGLGGITVVNLYALRSTDPSALAGHPDPVGSENDRVIAENCKPAQMVLAAWGAGFPKGDRPAEVAAIFTRSGRAMLCLGVTKDGHPRHPLYVRGDVTPTVFKPRSVPATRRASDRWN